MGVRLFSEFRSDRGDKYKIEIHDTQFVAASTEFKVDSRGFELTYDGETDDIVSPIVGSKLTFGAYSTDGTFETFIALLKTFQETRFRIVVYRASGQDIASDFETRVVSDGGIVESLSCVTDAVTALGVGAYELYWVGWLTQDLVNIEDVSQPYIYEMTATDGLGRLANIDYTADNAIIQANGFKATKVVDVIKNALVNIGTSDLWGAGDVFFETSVDWWETTAQTYSTATDPLAGHAFDVRLFNEFDDDGNVVRSSSFEFLRQIATLYNARIFIQRGRFVFEQYGNRDTSSRYVSRYTKTATPIARVLITDDVDVDQTLMAARRSGNNYNFLPAVKKVSAHFIQRFLSLLGEFGVFGGFHFSNAVTTYPVGFIAGGPGIQLFLGSNFNFKVAGPFGIVDQLLVIFKIRIRIQDSSTGTFYYYNRPFLNVSAIGPMFGAPSWSTTAGEYFFDLPLFFTPGPVVFTSPVAGGTFNNIGIVTDDLPASGELDLILTLHGIFRAQTNSAGILAGTTFTPAVPATFDASFLFGIKKDGADSPPGTTFSSNNTTADVDSNIVLELGDVFLADGPRQTGHLSAFNGTDYVATADWRKGSSGAGLPILKLLTNETLALHVRPIEQYNGSIIGSFGIGQRVVFNSSAYLMTGGTFTANVDEWSATWYRIQTIRASVTALAEVNDLVTRSVLGSATTSGESPNDIIGGRIGGMIINIDEQKVGPYEQVGSPVTPTGGRINGTANVTGVATMEKTTIVGLEQYIDAFVARVTADGGVTESRSCISSAITTLANGQLVSLIPTALSSTLNATEAVTMGKTLGVAGATSLSSTLGVTGTATLGTLNAAATSVSTLNASGAATLSSTLGVTGAASLASTLGVTGATTMNATTINGAATLNAKSSVNGSWNANIRDIDAGAGADYSVEETDYILFLSYSGGAGTFTIYLPPVDANEGRMIRIKTDSTISNSKALSIVPDPGDTAATIDGGDGSAMTRPYDGATYLAHNGDWWVIQKKEK